MEPKAKKKRQDEQPTQLEQPSLEVSMLNKDSFSDEELESYLSKGAIKACDEKPFHQRYCSLVIVLLPHSVISVLPQVRQRAKRRLMSLQWLLLPLQILRY